MFPVNITTYTIQMRWIYLFLAKSLTTWAQKHFAYVHNIRYVMLHFV